MPSMIYLIPELCTLTGLTDQMKADFKVMKDVAQFTRVTPTQRQEVSSTCSQYNIKLIFSHSPGSPEVPEERERLC